MTKSFTLNHVVKFLYRETSLSESIEVSEALNADPVLKRDFYDLQTASRYIPNVKFKPSGAVMERVLAHSRRD